MNQYRHLTQAMSILGTVRSIDRERNTFVVATRGGEFTVHVQPNTFADAVRNLDDLWRTRRRRDKEGASEGDWRFSGQVFVGDLVGVNGIWHHNEGHQRFDAVAIRLLHSSRGYLHFEHTNWWIRQLVVMADKWLDDLFGDRRSYEVDDFAALYRTNLNILGLPTDDDSQEMATLSRLIYGLSSAYLVNGDERYYRAARAGVHFQQQAFRSYSTDGRFCFWYHAIQRRRYVNRRQLASGHRDDSGGIPLYEQIYALSGLAMYFRITGDRDVLQDMRRTVHAMRVVWGDWRVSENGTRELNGFYSHIDPVTFTPDDDTLASGGADNRLTKNWNSIGDHIPAYLMNLVLALDPLPYGSGDPSSGLAAEIEEFVRDCNEVLFTTARLIRERFPERGIPYVQERFRKIVSGAEIKDWEPDKCWFWQQNLAVVGHNFKIAWNLTRVGNRLLAQGNKGEADRYFAFAHELGRTMGVLGVDQVRSGVYDTVQRVSADTGVPLQFGWWNSKDFWQQEQGILACLILYGNSRGSDLLAQARELSAFWNLYFLDRERAGVFFRVNDNGQPVIEGEYGQVGSHSKSGYHVFELGFLAHVYQMAYLPRAQRQHTSFALHFRPDPNSGLRAINVLPDSVAPDAFEVQDLTVDGISRLVADTRNFQVPLEPSDLGRKVVVRLWQSKGQFGRLSQDAPPDDHLP